MRVSGLVKLLLRVPVCGLPILLWLLFSLFSPGLQAASDQAASLSCPDEYRITADFDNGAGWDFCWESKLRENIVLSDIHFKSPQGLYTRVISSLRLAQLHVTYDDGIITYNDVTQFGLGGGHIADLADAECPDGELININDKPGMCKQVTLGDDAYRSTTESRLTQALTLFSVSYVGAYSYIVTWKFHDDGSIEPSVGAAGALQRSSSDEDSPFGRVLEGLDSKSWLSHTHNYYWRVDFDLGDDATNDIVSEVSYRNDADGRRVRQVEQLTTEVARKINPESMLSWRIIDGPADGRSDKLVSGNDESAMAKGFVIEPLYYGHKLVRSEIEPFTEFDFFVTRQNDCERFLSENSKFNPECGDNILEYINAETVLGQDIVVWHRISFHHVPRNEDRSHMHSHWDGFMMQARNLSSVTPGHSGFVENSPPVLTTPVQLINNLREPVSMAITADDPDGDALEYSAVGLPDGIVLTPAGMLQGTATRIGSYRSVISVTDGKHTSNALIQWQVSSGSAGAGTVSPSLFLSLIWLLIRPLLRLNCGRVMPVFFRFHIPVKSNR